MNIEIRLSLTLGVGGFWSQPIYSVEALFDHALLTLRSTSCAKLRREIIRNLFYIAADSSAHSERIWALLTLSDFYVGGERCSSHLMT